MQQEHLPSTQETKRNIQKDCFRSERRDFVVSFLDIQEKTGASSSNVISSSPPTDPATLHLVNVVTRSDRIRGRVPSSREEEEDGALNSQQ